MSEQAQAAGNTQATGSEAQTAATAPTEGTTALTSTATPEGEGAATSQQATEGTKSGDGKTEATTSTEGDAGKTTTEGDDKTGAKPTGAPEKYEFKAPEGQQYDPNVLTAFSEIAKELDLPQDAAQKVLDKMGPALAQRSTEAVETLKTTWGDATKADKELGGEKLGENLAVAKKALDAFGTPELRTLLEQTGLGNNPEIIRAFYRAGKQISEDRFVQGGQRPSGNGAKDAAKALYPNQ